MFGFIIGLIILLAVLLILVVLIQNPKGGGMASQFGSSNQFFGVKKTTDVIEQLTWGFSIAIMVLCLASYTLMDKNTNTEIKSANTDAAQSKNIPSSGGLAPGVAPSTPASATPAQPAPKK